LTSEQLIQARAERMRQNGLGTLSLDEARTWIEETGLCLFLPKRQFSSSVAPSFVEAVAGRPETTPDQKIIALAEDLLVRLENEGVAVRLNLQGQPGEQPDFVVAAWVLPYVYALRGDRDWRRSPQLTGSRQVSQLAVHVYKQLEGAELTVSQLKQALGREVSEAAVVRAITELWQQLRIIPVIAARGQAAKWQLLRTRFQRAIAEGASTSQVTAISVLASIYLQAVIAGSMEDVELFLAPLTARSKIREVIRGLVATRQVHTISLGHAPHFYVAGTLPEFEPVSAIYASSGMSTSSYFTRSFDRDDEAPKPAISVFSQPPAIQQPVAQVAAAQNSVPAPVAPSAPLRTPEAVAPEHRAAGTAVRRPAGSGEFSRASGNGHSNGHVRNGHDRKAARPSHSASSSNGHGAHRGSESRKARPQSRTHSSSGNGRWGTQKNGKAKHASAHASNGTRSSKTTRVSGSNGTHRTAKTTGPAWNKRTASAKSKPAAARKGPAHTSRPTLATAGRASASGKRFFNNRSKNGTGTRTGNRTGQGTKKRG
jgi:23S rRNA pseudouridine2605 synthase